MLGFESIKNAIIVALQPQSVVSGQKTVTAAGTAVVLGSSTALKQGVTIIPHSTNTGNIYVGASGVSSSTGAILSPGHPGIFVACDNITDIYINSAVNGEGVSFIGG